jgi:8-oxo-dGTP pyrophosphatase MutT (NUDIX family)
MEPWPPPCYRRAVAYVTDPAGQLLVFDHVDVASSGTQVPAGGIHDGEPPEVAVVRELAEETGIEGADLIRKLGEAWNRSLPANVPPGLEEQTHHAFHLHLAEPTVAREWRWEECSGGDVVEHLFRCYWLDLDDAATALFPIQAMWLPSLRRSLELVLAASSVR